MKFVLRKSRQPLRASPRVWAASISRATVKALASATSDCRQDRRGGAGRVVLRTVNRTVGLGWLDQLGGVGTLQAVNRCSETRGAAQNLWSLRARCAAPCAGQATRAPTTRSSVAVCLIRVPAPTQGGCHARPREGPLVSH